MTLVFFQSGVLNAFASTPIVNNLSVSPVVEGCYKTGKIKVSPLPGGTNIYGLELGKQTDGEKLRERLSNEYNIRIAAPDDKKRFFIYVNETLLNQTPDYIINAFVKCM